jgi:hypothetical protein
MTIKTLYLPAIISDEECLQLKGQFIDDGYVIHTIDYDCDIYDMDTKQFICSFRKRRLKNSRYAWDNYKHFATVSRGRGASAGPIDHSSPYWKRRQLTNTKGYSTSYMVKGKQSKMRVNNPVGSAPIGFFEKTKALNIDAPCRLTFLTKNNLNQYEAGKPYLHELDRWYQKLRPVEHKKQLDRANLQPDFKIDHTAFSTITINRNFRTALHQDAGDYGGIAVLSCLEYGKYRGALFTILKYGIGINLRQDDILVADVHQFHSNTEIWTTPEDDAYNDTLYPVFKLNDQHVASHNEKYSRITFVSYLREKLIHCS